MAIKPKPRTGPAGRNLGVVDVQNGRGRAVLLSEADPQTGVAVVHAKRMDFLDDWLDKDRITEDQWQTARDFQANWYRAGNREKYGSIMEIIARGQTGANAVADRDGLSSGADAERYIRLALAPLGPDQKSVVINVLGFEKSLRQCMAVWSTNGKATNVDRLSGLLQAALETMAVTIRQGGRR